MWNEARTEALKGYCATTLTAAEIAEKLNAETGAAFTRNAIIGKATRMGWMEAKPKQQPHVKRDKPKREYKRAVRAGTGFMVVEQFEVDLSPIVDTSPLPSLGLSLFDLGEKHCRYVTSGDGWQAKFCGNDKAKGSSYCPHHHSVCCL